MDPRWLPDWHNGEPTRTRSVGVERTPRERGTIERIEAILRDLWALIVEVWEGSRWA